MSMDQQIGRNLARLRGGMTQQELASKMKALGHKWSQSTVWAVEKGDRPLRLAEATSLGSALGSFPLGMLLWGDGASQVQGEMRRVSDLWQDLRTAYGAFRRAQEDLALTADQVGADQLAELHPDAIRDWLQHDGATLDELHRQELEIAALREQVEFGPVPTEPMGPFTTYYSEQESLRDEHPEAP